MTLSEIVFLEEYVFWHIHTDLIFLSKINEKGKRLPSLLKNYKQISKKPISQNFRNLYDF